MVMSDFEILTLIDEHIQKLRDAREKRPNWRPYIWQIAALTILKNQIMDRMGWSVVVAPTKESEADHG